ncbi:hypothetical protein [Rhodanobacter lindaniclasticus]
MKKQKKPAPPLPIACQPDHSINDETCTVCGDEKMWLVIKGRQNCGYCGNQINLCQKCYYRFRLECIALQLDSGTAYEAASPGASM